MGKYLFNANNKVIGTKSMDIVPESLLLLTLNRWQCGRSGVFIINFEHILHLAIVFLLLTLNMQLLSGEQLFAQRLSSK